MRTKTPKQIYEQTISLLNTISTMERTEVTRTRWRRIINVYEKYTDNIYALHTDDENSLSVEESNYIWNNAATPVINYLNK